MVTRRTIGAVLAALVVAGGAFALADTGVNEPTVASEVSTTFATSSEYDRDEFGRAWADVDKNGCGTRDDILARDLDNVTTEDGCVILSGTLTLDPYTADTIEYMRGASRVDIDHILPLKYLWDHGASSWTAEQRLAVANDGDNLLAVSSSANRSKGSSGPAEWLPVNEGEWCAYADAWTLVAEKYDVTLGAADVAELETIEEAC